MKKSKYRKHGIPSWGVVVIVALSFCIQWTVLGTETVVSLRPSISQYLSVATIPLIENAFYSEGTLDGSNYAPRFLDISTDIGKWWQHCESTPFTGGRVDCVRRFNYGTFKLSAPATLDSIHVWIGGFNNWGRPSEPTLKVEIYLGDPVSSANDSALIATSNLTIVGHSAPTGAERTFTFSNPVALLSHTPYTIRIHIPSGTFGDFASSGAFSLFGAAEVPECVTPPSGLVSWWRGDSNTKDSVGENHGTLFGDVSFVPGFIGEAFSFPNASSFLFMGSPQDLRLTSGLTIDAWINPTEMTEGQEATIVSKWGQSTLLDSYTLFLRKQNGLIELVGAIGVANVSDQGFSGGRIPVNSWSHLAMTYDASTGANILYVNGQQVALRTWRNGIFESDSNFLIGRENSSKPRPFTGLIDEADIFDRALSGSEILAISLASTGKCVPNILDSDGDGLSDEWETNGYTFDGTFVSLQSMGANPRHKDIFVEVDYMSGHRPSQEALDIVRDSFARVPNEMFEVPNPDGLDGITLHVIVDDEIPHKDQLGVNNNGNYEWQEFDSTKNERFSKALSLSHHYCLFIHDGPRNKKGDPASGIARGTPSSDFIVSLGTREFHGIPIGEGGTVSEQAGTFMHELGHNLGLTHGGGFDGINYKPNYLSVMNYAFQLTGLRYNGSYGLFDYSRFLLPQLDESHLNEHLGLREESDIAGYGTTWFCPGDGDKPSGHVDNAQGEINWNCNKKFLFFEDIEEDIAADINGANPNEVLVSFNDWAHLRFKGGLVGAGAVSPLPSATTNDEIDVQTLTSIKPFPTANLIGQFEGCAITLNWTAAGPIGEYSYKIYRSEDGGGFVVVATTDSTSYTDKNLNLAHTFSYHVTTVNISATEGSPSAVIIMKGAADLLDQLALMVLECHLESDLQEGLLDKLLAAKESLRRNDNHTACNQVSAFVNQTFAQSGKKLTAIQASQLRAQAENIRALSCCP
jgi:Concanavalin A-like lectin/glucanases superfamily